MAQVGFMRDRARRLRRDQTDAERKLWSQLRGRQVNGAKFRRQHSIGHYIVDFCCQEQGLVVEFDGAQHTVRTESDQRRTAFLIQSGFRILRFWDHDALVNTDVVMQQIAEAVTTPSPLPSPPRWGRGE